MLRWSFLCSISDKGSNYLIKYKYENQNLTKKIEKKTYNRANIFIELNDEISASGDRDIYFWKN